MHYTEYRWMAQASCKDYDSAVFFPENTDNTTYKQAKAICADCPVRLECLEYACRNAIVDGLWGGLAPKERRRAANVNGWAPRLQNDEVAS